VSDAVELLRRYLKQRLELGEDELVLEGTAADLLSPRRPSATLREPLGSPFPSPDVSPGESPGLTVLGASTLKGVQDRANLCVACRLSETRTTVVFGEGDPDAALMVVGEAPGSEEDRTGRPFVGRAGKLLDRLLISVGYSRESVYICNVVKCRPPGNRNPQPDEVAACRGFLRLQVELVRPRAILALGNFPAQTLLESREAISRLRGSVHLFGEIPLVPTYHPAAVLRNPGWIRPVWEDLQRLRGLLDR